MPCKIEEIDGERIVRKLSLREVWLLVDGAVSQLRQVVGKKGYLLSSISSGIGMALIPLVSWVWDGAIAVLDVEKESLIRLEKVLDLLQPVVILVANEQERDKLKQTKTAALLLTRNELFATTEEQIIGSAPPQIRRWPPFETTSQDISHCYFTSGSTGIPKGCVVSRYAMQAYVLGRNKNDQVSSESRIAICSSHTFDPSLGDVAQAAQACATIIVSVSPVSHTMLSTFVQVAAPSHITTTPRLWLEIYGDGISLAKDRAILVSLGGEFTPGAIVFHFKKNESYTLQTVYGTTECCVYQTSCLIKSVTDLGLLGPPLLGVEVRLLDCNGAILYRAQDEGEILLGGAQIVGAHYLGYTEENRFFYVDQTRFYKTGDRGRIEIINDQEQIRLLGRIDTDEIKLRGVRTALPEVEALLAASCPSHILSGCCAFKLGSILAACLDIAGQSSESNSLLRVATRAEMTAFSILSRHSSPERLVPSAWFVLITPNKKWPMTGSGKTDRDKLRQIAEELQRSHEMNEDDSVCKTRTEVAVSRMWRELLLKESDPRINMVSASDDFLLMGGDSIVALRAARRLEFWLSGLEKPGAQFGGGPAGDEPVPNFPPHTMLSLRTCRKYAASLGDLFAHDDRFTPQVCNTNNTINNQIDASFTMPFTSDDLVDIDQEEENEEFETALSLAVEEDRIDLLSTLLCSDALPMTIKQNKAKRAPTPLHIAAARGHTECVRLLLKHYKCTAVDAIQRTPLAYAAAYGHSQVCEQLLAAGVPLTARDRNKQTCLHACLRGGNLMTLELLLSAAREQDVANSILDARDRWGRPPLTWLALRASSEEQLDMAKKLLDAGATPNPPAVQGKSTHLAPETPLEVCCRLVPPDGGEFGTLIRTTHNNKKNNHIDYSS